jgi:hypothetical protein
MQLSQYPISENRPVSFCKIQNPKGKPNPISINFFFILSFERIHPKSVYSYEAPVMKNHGRFANH